MTTVFPPCSRSLGRFSTGYDQGQFNPHLFSGDVAARGASGVVGSYSPYLPGTLNVPGLEGYQGGVVGGGYGSPSALQQALLSPTPLDYRPPQHHVTPTLQGLLSPRHSLSGHADPRLPAQDLASLLKRQSPRRGSACAAISCGPGPQEYEEMLLRQLSQGESLEAPAQQAAAGGPHFHHLLQIRSPEVPQQPPAPQQQPGLPHSESMEEDEAEAPASFPPALEVLLAKAAESHELLGPPRGGTPPYTSPTHRQGFMRSGSTTRGKAPREGWG